LTSRIRIAPVAEHSEERRRNTFLLVFLLVFPSRFRVFQAAPERSRTQIAPIGESRKERASEWASLRVREGVKRRGREGGRVEREDKGVCERETD
jgi:hypothetical protein